MASRPTVLRVHAGSGLVALFASVVFTLCSLVAIASPRTLEPVIEPVLAGLLGSMVVAGLTGEWLSSEERPPLINAKLRRVRTAAAVVAFVLVPCAVWSGPEFVGGQAAAVLGGVVTTGLLALNARVGLALRKTSRK